MPSGWLKERALGGSSLGRGEDAWFCSPPRRPACRRHTPHAARRPTHAPCPSRSPARRARAALVPGSARPVASHPSLAAPRAAPRRACTRQLSSSPRTLRRPAAQRSRRTAPGRAAQRPPLAPPPCVCSDRSRSAPAWPTRSEFAQINSNFPYLVKKFLDGLRFTSYLSQLHFFADSRILLKEERPRGPRKNR